MTSWEVTVDRVTYRKPRSELCGYLGRYLRSHGQESV